MRFGIHSCCDERVHRAGFFRTGGEGTGELGNLRLPQFPSTLLRQYTSCRNTSLAVDTRAHDIERNNRKGQTHVLETCFSCSAHFDYS